MPQQVIHHTKDPEIEKLRKEAQQPKETSTQRKKRVSTASEDNAKENDVEWDLFICHATEDKKGIARPLAYALVKVGFRVWYDEFTLTIGDSLRRSIDKGLAQSTHGLVILSSNFFKKNWPQIELDGLAAREHDGKKVILPVWHKVDREYIMKFSPILADRLAVSTKKGVDYVVKEVVRAVKHAHDPVGPVARFDPTKVLSLTELKHIWNSLSTLGRNGVLILYGEWSRDNSPEQTFIIPFVRASRMALGGPLEELRDAGLIGDIPSTDSSPPVFNVFLTKPGLSLLMFFDRFKRTGKKDLQFFRVTVNNRPIIGRCE